MANPTIRDLGSIQGKIAISDSVGSNSSWLVYNSSSSGVVYKINAIFAANVDSQDRTCRISHCPGSITDGSFDTYLAYDLVVPTGATQVVATKETYFYIQEGYGIRASTPDGVYIDYIVCYEILDDNPSPLGTNIMNPSAIYGKSTVRRDISTSSLQNMLGNIYEDHKYKINSIFVSNTTSSDVTVDVQLDINDRGTDLGTAYLVKNLIIPGNSTQIVSTKETYFYLPSGSSDYGYIYAKASASGVDMLIGYEDIRAT